MRREEELSKRCEVLEPRNVELSERNAVLERENEDLKFRLNTKENEV